MIHYVKGDMLAQPRLDMIVNTVNTVGIMGKGIALSFKNKYPDMFEKYVEDCKYGRILTRRPIVYQCKDMQVLCFATKQHWRNPSKLRYIADGLKYFKANYRWWNIKNIGFIKLGCGNGKLDWNEVRPIMEFYLKDLELDIYIFVNQN